MKPEALNKILNETLNETLKRPTWTFEVPKCSKCYANVTNTMQKWKANMAKCSKYHAKCKVTMPKCSKYHAKWQVLVPNCCKYKANGIWKESQKKIQNLRQKNTKNFSTPIVFSRGWLDPIEISVDWGVDQRIPTRRTADSTPLGTLARRAKKAWQML